MGVTGGSVKESEEEQLEEETVAGAVSLRLERSIWEA